MYKLYGPLRFSGLFSDAVHTKNFNEFTLIRNIKIVDKSSRRRYFVAFKQKHETCFSERQK